MFRNIPLPDSVKLDHFPDLDHTQLLERDRRRLIEAIARGIAER
jgi:hypothetical protein